MLSGKDRRFLRAQAHSLRPLVQIGKGDVTEAVIAAVDQALADHELIKVKVGENATTGRHDIATQLAEATLSHVAQVLGNTIVLYRERTDDPVIALPSKKSGNN